MTGRADWTPQVPVLMFMSVIGDLSGLGSTTGTVKRVEEQQNIPGWRLDALVLSLIWSGLVWSDLVCSSLVWKDLVHPGPPFWTSAGPSVRVRSAEEGPSKVATPL